LATEHTDTGSGQGVQQPSGVPVFDDNQANWVLNTVDLVPYLGEANVRFRFRLMTDNSQRRDGFFFDDIQIAVVDDGSHVAVEMPAFHKTSVTAYPNPFNPQTAIQYVTATTGLAHLAVYDIQGRLIRTLFGGSLLAGSHTTVWDGRADNGDAASSGVYFAKLRSADQQRSVKLMLVK